MIRTSRNGGSTQITPTSDCGFGSDAGIGLQSAHQSAPASCSDGHEWVVFSTNVSFGCMMLQCVRCGSHGTVDDPTEEEWSEAYYAPARPYLWGEDARVTTRRGPEEPFVIRATGGPGCECYSRGMRPEPGSYDRFPAEIMGPLEGLTDEARDELRREADFVGMSDLCSLLYPHFVRCFEEDTGHRHSDVLHEVVRRIERIDSKGLHCSPGVVAEVLRGFASQAA